MARGVGSVTKGGRARTKSRLEVRQAAYDAQRGNKDAFKRPGSNNSHKSWPH